MILQLFILSISYSVAMHIPHETEVLDGYSLNTDAEIYPEDEYFELRSLAGHRLLNPIRDKRSPKYVVLASPGLKSHFRTARLISHSALEEPTNVEVDDYERNNKHFMQNIAYDKLRPPQKRSEFINDANNAVPRIRRNADYPNEVETSPSAAAYEELPIAEKQYMDDENSKIFDNGESRSASNIMSRWTKAPSFEYSKIQEDDDSLAEASVNEGIKARTPRVNFVTQKKSISGDEVSDLKPSATKIDTYLNAQLTEKPTDRYYSRQMSTTPERYQQPEEEYYRGYDR